LLMLKRQGDALSNSYPFSPTFHQHSNLSRCSRDVCCSSNHKPLYCHYTMAFCDGHVCAHFYKESVGRAFEFSIHLVQYLNVTFEILKALGAARHEGRPSQL
jgi:hypothetical protein